MNNYMDHVLLFSNNTLDGWFLDYTGRTILEKLLYGNALKKQNVSSLMFCVDILPSAY